MTLKKIILFSLAICTFFCFIFLPHAALAQFKRNDINHVVFKNVHIITMTSPNTVIRNANLVISGNRIESINGLLPKDAKIIDCNGKWLIPGLIDMHVHLLTDSYFGKKQLTQVPDLVISTQDVMTPIVANGVTMVLDLNSTMETFSQRKEIEKGYIIGPRIALTALVNGGSGNGRIANSPEEGRTIVKNIKAEGYDFVKLYSNLTIETYNAIIDEAFKHGLKSIGHIPNAFQGKLDQAFIPHFGMVAHAEEFSKHSKSYSREDALQFAAYAKANGTWLSPTLTAMDWIAKQSHSLDSIKVSPTLQYVHPLLQSKWLTANNYNRNTTPERAASFDSMVKFHKLLVKVFKETGVPIVTGTDAGVSGVVAGFALHDELELLVDAGLTPEEALSSATRLSAQWLGLEKITGTIEAGNLADLVLLDENPLEKISNTRKIAGVMVNGKWIDKLKLDALLSDLSKRNAAAKNMYDWKTIINKQP